MNEIYIIIKTVKICSDFHSHLFFKNVSENHYQSKSHINSKNSKNYWRGSGISQFI